MDLIVEHSDSWRPVHVRSLIDKFEGLDPKAQKSSSDNTRKAKFEGLDPNKLINQKSSTVNTRKAKAVISYSGLTESMYIVGGRKFDSWLSEADCYVPSQDLMKSLPHISSACATSTVKFEGLDPKAQKSSSDNTRKAKFEGLDPYKLINQKSSSDNTRKAKFEGLDPNKLINQKSSTVNTRKAKAYLGFTESIYIVGGRKFDSWLSEADCYVPSQDLMKSLSPIRSACATSTVKVYGHQMVLGGFKEYGLWYDIVESYNPFINRWHNWPSLSKKKGGLAGVELERKVYAIGGGDETGELSDVEVLDVAGSVDWTKLPSMQEKRFAAAAAKLYDSIYVVGGYNGVRYLESVERYDPRDCRSWTTYADLSGSMRAFHSVAVVNEKIYAVGGYDGFSSISNTDIFDPRMNSWIEGPDMNAQRGCFTMAVLGDTIFVMGGQNSFGCITTVETLKDKGGWEVTELEGIGARCFASATVL